MADFRALDPNALADFAENVSTLLGGTELSAIDSNVRTDLLTAVGTLPATLATLAADQVIAFDAMKAATSVRDGVADEVIVLMGQVRDYLRAGKAPKDQWDLCGFDYPKERSINIPQTPVDLSGAGQSNGVNDLKFKGNNPQGGVFYEMYRREGDEGPWGLLGTTTRQNYHDTPVTPGQYYEYKVRAANSNGASDFSGSVVIYGTI